MPNTRIGMPNKIFSQFTNCLISKIDANIYILTPIVRSRFPESNSCKLHMPLMHPGLYNHPNILYITKNNNNKTISKRNKKLINNLI